MGRLDTLVSRIARGDSLDAAWSAAGFASREEAAARLEELALSIGNESHTEDPNIEHRAAVLPDGIGVERLIIYTDGASRGNPGPAAVAAVAYLPTGELLTTSAKLIGKTTNNVAEYSAVLEGLRLAAALGARHLICRLDSELVVKQLSGEYKVKNAALIELHQRVIDAVDLFESCSFEHVRRSENRDADRMAGRILDGKPPEE